MARQLTAFLPSNYSLAEEDEGVPTAKRQGKQRILLLENINLDAADFLKKAGFEVGLKTTETRESLTPGRPRHQGVL
jgi:D-3-phosphoglycerate dehydrogenase